MSDGIAKSGIRMSADERRRDVLVAAGAAFSRGGYAGTSTEEIARIAGISQPYLFRLYKTKKELFLAACGQCFDRVLGAFEAASGTLEGEAALDAMGLEYLNLVADGELLLLQLHAYAASADEEIRVYVAGRYSGLVSRIRERTGVGSEALQEFFATGMLLNVLSVLKIDDFPRLCEP